MLRKSKKGIMLVLVLILTFLLSILLISILKIITEKFNITGLVEKKVKAVEAAEAGVEYAFYQLNNDPSWGMGMTSDIVENLGDEQEFRIIFDPSRPYVSKNNLTNDTVEGTTPAFCAEIICEGTFKKVSKIYRAVFIREEFFELPASSNGEIYMSINNDVNSSDININGLNINDPAIIHGNGDVDIVGWSPINLDLNDGYISSSGNISVSGNGTTVKEKSSNVEMAFPDIDILEIINDNKASCIQPSSLPKFYLFGNFEYSAGNYCIPHSSHIDPGPVDTPVHSYPYKFGVATFEEFDERNYYCNMGDFFYNPPGTALADPPHLPPSPGRNLYNYYNPINFAEEGTPEFTVIENELGMTTSKTVDINGIAWITLTLNQDLYFPQEAALEQTAYIDYSFDDEYTNAYYYFSGLSHNYNPRFKLDLNGHNIYAEKSLLIGMPVGGKGMIFSEGAIQFIHGYDLELAAYAGESIEFHFCTQGTGGDLNFKGVLYTKKGFYFAPVSSAHHTDKYNFQGTIMNVNPIGNFHMWLILIDEINFTFSHDMADSVCSVRNNFNVRKKEMYLLK